MLISLHIPKSGGVSFAELLKQIYGDRLYLDYNDRPLAPGYVWREFSRTIRLHTPQVPSAAECIHGHFTAAKYRSLFPNATYAVWLRDPVERLASHYYYWKRCPDPAHPICHRLIREKLDLRSFARIKQMRNVQHRFLAHRPIEHFQFIGITEHFDRSLRLFQQIQGSSNPVASAKVNTNPDKDVAVYNLDDALRNEISGLNRKDVDLYTLARKLFDQLCETYNV